ncbi:MAG: YraN family protein [Patescibacteria group bacterium]
MHKNNKQIIGRLGEQLAEKYYQTLGFKLIAKNFYTRYGELDLVFKKRRRILLVEVKTRTNQNFGWPEEVINPAKIERMLRAYAILRNQLALDPDPEIEICAIVIKGRQAALRRYPLV